MECKSGVRSCNCWVYDEVMDLHGVSSGLWEMNLESLRKTKLMVQVGNLVLIPAWISVSRTEAIKV